WRWRLVGGLPGGDPPQALAQPAGDRSAVWDVAFSPDGLHLAAGRANGRMALWSNSARRPLPNSLAGHPAEVYALAFNPRRPLLAYSNGGGTIEVFDQAMGAFVSPSPAPLSGSVRQLAFSPDGRALAAVGSGTDNSVTLWDVVRGEPAGELRAPDDARLWRIALSPDGRTLAAGGCERLEGEACAQGAIHLWDLARKERIGQELVGHTDWVTGLAFSADSRLLASGSDDSTVRLWDVADPARARERGAPLTDHGEGAVIRSLAFSPAGRTLASGDRNGTIILWDASGRQPREVARLTDHGGAILSLAFSPDGRTLVSGSHDRTIRLWDVASRRPLGPRLAGHLAEVQSVAFRPDGKELASAGKDGRIFLWNVDLHSWRTTACEVAGRALHPAERESHLSSVAARPWRPAFEETCAQDALRRADAAALADEPERARAAFREAVVVAARTGDAWINNEVCWYGSIDGFAGAVLPACERAVQLAVGETEWQVRDSRGIALAVTGQLARAQEDFEQYAKWATDRDYLAPLLERRRRWIEQLKARQNPFADPAELRALRTESSLLLDQ
ncbi:MAG TPA: WD40 repeat domain-containing protein, partial [Chloroflexota bacterium]|nr:WD40 repeat domain-containing protein [Chloroflexota bacterium]